MIEKEKRSKGLLYDANNDLEIQNELLKCKDLCYKYNLLLPSKRDERSELLKELFNKTGENIIIESPFNCDFGYNIEVGDNFYANHGLVILDGAKVSIGNNCFIGPNCGFFTATHPIDYKQRNLGLEKALPIKVGNNVWFGGNVTCLDGVTIGDNVVIGAGSVITRDIPSNVLCYGSPCKVIKNI